MRWTDGSDRRGTRRRTVRVCWMWSGCSGVIGRRSSNSCRSTWELRPPWCEGAADGGCHVESNGSIPREGLDVGASALVVECRGEGHVTRRGEWSVVFRGNQWL